MAWVDRSCMSDKYKTAAEIFDYCTHVYGDCTDGSYEACLHYEGYYAMKNKESDLSKIINEYEERKDASNTNGDLQAV